MGRLGYITLVLLLVVGATYVFWPEPSEVQDPPLWRGNPPAHYQVLAGGLTQVVDGTKVRINDIERPLDSSRQDDLWSFVRSLTIKAMMWKNARSPTSCKRGSQSQRAAFVRPCAKVSACRCSCWPVNC